MGRKSRGKKHRKEWARKSPDEVFSRGPIKIARYGRYIRFSNNSTVEQHAAFLERVKEANKEIIKDLEHEVSILQSMVKKYDPVELMHRATYMLLPLFTKYGSENEYEPNESYYLPTVEYLQYLIARTEANADGKEMPEEEWEKIWAQATKILHLTQSYLLSRGTPTTSPSEIDRLRFDLDGRRLMMRVRRYPIFFTDYLRTSFAPYEKQIKEIYGVGVEEIIDGLKKIDEYQKTGVLGRYQDATDLTGIFSEKLRGKGYTVDPGASKEEIERTRAAIASEEFKALHDEIQEKMRLTFTPAIFEITDLTTLPKPFLSLLSVKPGESILTSLTGPNHDDLSQLSTSVLHYKPFLEVDGKFYSFYHSGFEDRIAEIIEADLFQKRPGEVSEMAKKRSDRIESESKDLLASIIRPDFAFQNVYYPNPDDSGNLTELDVLLGVDDILLLVEVKAGGFSDAASRGAPKSMAQEFSDLIIEGQRQSERAEKYIRSSDEAVFFDETGKQEIHRIKHSRFRKIFRVVITREDLGWVGAKIAVLSILDTNLSKSFPWHISIDDLRIVADLFKDDEVPFIHYLELRLLASSETALSQSDEIEHISLYNKMNHYHELPVKGMNRLSFDSSYMRDIDYYFMEKTAGGSPEIPRQAMPSKMRAFVDALKDSRLSGRFEVGSIILSMDSAGRNDFQKNLNALDTGMVEGRQRTFRLPFTALGFGLSITCFNNTHWEEELRRSAVQMEQGRCVRWLVVQIANKIPYEILQIGTILPGRFTDLELAPARSRHEEMTKRIITTEKTSRNDQCPCGSGKKFKRCHGFETPNN